MPPGQRSVRQLLLTLVIAGIALVLLVGSVGVVSSYATTGAVKSLSDDVNPAVRANGAVYQDMLDARAAVGSFGASGDPALRASYEQTMKELARDGRPLATYGDPGSMVRRLYARELAAVNTWVKEYAKPRLARGGGAGTFSAALSDKGVRLFRSVDAAHAALAERLDAEYGRAKSDAESRLRATIGLVAGSAVLGGLILALLGFWVLQRVRRPLTDLEDVVGRLTAGEHTARVVPAGPREIHRVGTALNHLAEETDRGRQVEAAIQTQLREVDAAKTDFIANVSHELRTPLTTITGYLELLREELADTVDERQAQMLDATARNLFRLGALIEDLLALDRAEHSGTALEQVDLRGAVEAAVIDLRIAAANRSVTLVPLVPESPVPALADASQIHRAVINLVSNAIKFSHAGGRVDVTLDTDSGREAVITVSDRGMGIPAAELPRLGARFFRASNAVRSEIGGTGLGLRIVQTIVTNHHGNLTVDSVEGEGTTVRLTLPLRAWIDPDAGPEPVADAAVVPEDAAEQTDGVSG
jgi:signal transduction histidine kinase